jgi:DNA-binding CsgD family transcriptional regulator
MASLLRVRGIEEIVRVVHGPETDLEPWARAVVDAIHRHVPGSAGVHLSVNDENSARGTVSGCSVDELGAESLSPRVRLAREVDERLRFALQVLFPTEQAPMFNDRDLLWRVALHVENAIRIRIRPSGVRGYVAPSGFASTDGTRLSRATIWAELVPRATTDGTQFVLVEVRRAASSRVLDDDEREVLRLFARGATSKRIGCELGVSQPVVSRCLNRAAAKIGVVSTRELLAVVARLAPPAMMRCIAPSALTAAEREVLALVRDGLSNDAIARRRVRSHRTVANQLASLLRKTGCESRRALASIATGDAYEPADELAVPG